MKHSRNWLQRLQMLLLMLNGDFEALKEKKNFQEQSNSVEAHLKEMVGTIGENMTLRRSEAVIVEEGIVASYMHNACNSRSW